MTYRTLLKIATGSLLAAALPCAYADGDPTGAASTVSQQQAAVSSGAGVDAQAQATPTTQGIPQATVPQDGQGDQGRHDRDANARDDDRDSAHDRTDLHKDRKDLSKD